MLLLSDKLNMFVELLHCAAPISFWHYNREMNLISSDSSQAELFHLLLSIDNCKQIMHTHCLENKEPAIISNHFHMTWVCVPVKTENMLTDIYVLGPTFHTIVSESNFGQAISSASIGMALKAATRKIMHEIPVISHSSMTLYARQLYYCLIGEHYPSFVIPILSQHPKEALPRNKDHSVPEHTPYSFELEHFGVVEKGDINFTFSVKDPLQGYEIGKLATEDPLRQAKNEMLVNVTLSSRAAMRGGMDPESAYTLSDYYFQAVENATTISEAYQYGSECYREFTYQVHQHKQYQYSKEIMNCISYINAHLNQRISLETVAQAQGFNKNYLSSRFKKEVGKTVGDYIAEAKIERAKFLLDHYSDYSISDISDRLCYSSESYFSSNFHKLTGMTPSEYRNRINTVNDRGQ